MCSSKEKVGAEEQPGKGIETTGRQVPLQTIAADYHLIDQYAPSCVY
jgi:hypothetical protein